MRLYITTMTDDPDHITMGNIGQTIQRFKHYFDVKTSVMDGTVSTRTLIEKAKWSDAVLIFSQPFVLWKLVNKVNVPLFLWHDRLQVSEHLHRTSGLSELIFTPHYKMCAIRRGRVERIRIVKYGIDTDIFSPTVKTEHDGIKLLSCGVIYKHAGFLRIAQEIEDSGRNDITYTICGNAREGDEDYLNELTIFPFVTIIKPYKWRDSAEMYRAHDIYVDPNEKAAPHIETLQAMSCGTPSYVYSPNYYGYVPEEWFIPRHGFCRYVPQKMPKYDYSELHTYIKERYDLSDYVKNMADMIEERVGTFVPYAKKQSNTYYKEKDF